MIPEREQIFILKKDMHLCLGVKNVTWTLEYFVSFKDDVLYSASSSNYENSDDALRICENFYYAFLAANKLVKKYGIIDAVEMGANADNE